MTVASEPSCPACSKYDYEEKVLERMIRMEFAFEKVLKENKIESETVEQDLTRIKEENEHQIATPLVYFNAYSPQTSSLSTGEVIVYKTVDTNQGDGYSSTTGKFTAPARGLYLLVMHTCTKSNNYANLHMLKEGSVLIASVYFDKDASHCSSSQVFVQLDVGETVREDNHDHWPYAIQKRYQ
ncbi:heavy metal-binding protein HIP-like [Mya arenaria]|uniref:heavy metal-binding protein HIP-like n=1 Tax=Mya arenaria TaxID=6604 RepID=UPI0022E7B07F|nr:heavy metal-binding protein HIP-like [Mya arenaria]